MRNLEFRGSWPTLKVGAAPWPGYPFFTHCNDSQVHFCYAKCALTVLKAKAFTKPISLLVLQLKLLLSIHYMLGFGLGGE